MSTTSRLEPIVKPNCKICQSPNRLEAERRLIEHQTPRAVERWLFESFGERISHVAINHHRGKHMAMRDEVKKQLAIAKAARNQLETATKLVLAEIEGLDEVFTYARDIAMIKKAAIVAGSTSMIDALCLKWMLVEMREAVRAKHELTNGKKVNLVQDGLLGFLREGHADEDGGD